MGRVGVYGNGCLDTVPHYTSARTWNVYWPRVGNSIRTPVALWNLPNYYVPWPIVYWRSYDPIYHNPINNHNQTLSAAFSNPTSSKYNRLACPALGHAFDPSFLPLLLLSPFPISLASEDLVADSKYRSRS